jgi:hypothetical protein
LSKSPPKTDEEKRTKDKKPKLKLIDACQAEVGFGSNLLFVIVEQFSVKCSKLQKLSARMAYNEQGLAKMGK